MWLNSHDGIIIDRNSGSYPRIQDDFGAVLSIFGFRRRFSESIHRFGMGFGAFWILFGGVSRKVSAKCTVACLLACLLLVACC